MFLPKMFFMSGHELLLKYMALTQFMVRTINIRAKHDREAKSFPEATAEPISTCDETMTFLL